MTILGKVKAFAEAKCPTCVFIIKKILGLRYKRKPTERVFWDDMYRKGFGGQDPAGTGADVAQTSVIRREIPTLVREISARSMLDAACGDFYWVKQMELDLDRYIGIDIVPQLIVHHQQKYGDANREFLVLDITKDDLPQVDIILCRDCLPRLPFKHITSIIANFKRSKSKYLLTTTFTRSVKNIDIAAGQWRVMNLQLPPFNFPEPIKLINEECTEADGRFSDKSLALWKLEDILV